LGSLEIRQSEFTYSASLRAPVFEILGTGGKLFAAIYAGLSRFRVKLQDIKVENLTWNPSDISVICSLVDLGALVRYRLDRVEVWSTSLLGFGEPRLLELVEDALRAGRDVSPTAEVAVHTFSLGIHGLPAEGDVEKWLAAYVSRPPDGTPPFRLGGVSFFCEWPEGESESSFVLERSVMVPAGAFLRVTSVHSGRLPEREAYKRAANFFETLMTRFNIRLLRGT
jgi:hypothetical protein